MKIINLYGSSGSGKSTSAAGLSFELKMKGYKVELLNEFAKELCILKTEHLLENQLWVFANQYQKTRYLSKDLDFVVTDSPLLLSDFFGSQYEYEYKNLSPLIKEIHNSYDNINIFLNRQHSWDSYARVESEQESSLISIKLKEYLKDNNQIFKEFSTSSDFISELVNYIETFNDK